MLRLTLIILGACLMFCSAASAEPETCWIPQFVNCPEVLTWDHCDSISYQLQAINPHTGEPDPAIRYHLVYGPGQIDSLTGLWTSAGVLHLSSTNISASQGSFETSREENCAFMLNPLDRRPWLTIDGAFFGDTIDLRESEVVRFPVAYGDSDECDLTTIAAYVGWTDPLYARIADENGPELVLEARLVSEEYISQVRIVVGTAAGSTQQCLYVRLHPAPVPPPFTLQIDHLSDVIQGLYVDVGVTFESNYWYDIAGFNFFIQFDNSAMTFSNAALGPAFGPDGCGWEYFTFRYGADGNCGDACPTGLVRVVGMAETNNGPYHPDCFQPDSLPATLFNLRFLVSNDRTIECATLPVRFFWIDCTDNCLATSNDQILHISRSVANYDQPEVDISDPNAGFPTYLGAQSSCDSSTSPYKPAALRTIAFVNGAVDVVCAEPIDATGDLNLNGLRYEITDYNLFRLYFVMGLSAFTIDANGQIATSDVNQDGHTLSLTDLVSLNRVIRGEVTPPVGPPKVSPELNTIVTDSRTGETIIEGPDSLGALLLEYDAVVAPLIVPYDVQVWPYSDSTHTRILLAPAPGQSAFIAPGFTLITSPGANLVLAQAATILGDSVVLNYKAITDIGDDPASLPTAFALHPNYPNPFNATTVISFDLPRAENVTLDIVNLLGQRVYTHSRQYNQGTHAFTWDGTDNSGRTVASGVYYFRLTAGEYVATQKMMLLK